MAEFSSGTYIADGSIITAKLADDAVTAAKIAADQVGDSELVNSNIALTRKGGETPPHDISSNFMLYEKYNTPNSVISRIEGTLDLTGCNRWIFAKDNKCEGLTPTSNVAITDAANATDGASSFASIPNGVNNYIQVDMGASFTGYAFYKYQSTITGATLKLQYSTDGTAWSDAATDTPGTTWKMYMSAQITARYIRILETVGVAGTLNIRELGFFATSDCVIYTSATDVSCTFIGLSTYYLIMATENSIVTGPRTAVGWVYTGYKEYLPVSDSNVKKLS